MDEPTTEIVATLERERAGLLATLDGLRPEDWSRTAAGDEGWTVKDIVAHLAASDRSMGSLIRAIAEGRYRAQPFSVDDFNARGVERARDSSYADVRRDLDENRTAFLNGVRGVEGDILEADVWSPGVTGDKAYVLPLRDRLLEYATHDSHHGDQIRRMLD